MYLRAIHAESHIPTLWQLIRDYPLGVLTTAIPSPSGSHPLIQQTHVPMVLDADEDGTHGQFGRLRAHMARPNPHSKAFVEALTADGETQGQKNVLEQEVCVLFTSPVTHYVTPKFYTETKPDTGKVVPTWNYAAAQAYGRMRVYYDSKAQDSIDFLSKQVDDLSDLCEKGIMGSTGEGDAPKPWKVSDAPDRYVEIMMKNIIGIEIEIDRLEGKFKMSQEMGTGDRQGVIAGFRKMDSEVGRAVGELVSVRSEKSEAAKKAARAG